MVKSFHCILISLLTIIIYNPTNSPAESPNNTYISISKCIGNIRPAEDSEVKPIFDKILRQINPTLNEKDFNILEKWFGTQSSNIQQINQALETNHIEFPPIDVKTMDLPMFTDYRSVLALKLVQAKIYLNKNEMNLATVSILEAIKFGRMVRYGERSTILHYMIGTSIEKKSLRWLQNILCMSSLGNKTLQQVLNTIQPEGVKDEAFLSAIEYEFNNFIIPLVDYYSKLIEPIITQLEMNRMSIFDREESISGAIKQLQQIIKNANSPWSERNWDKLFDDDEYGSEIATQLEEFESLIPHGEKNKFDINNAEQVTKWKELEKLAKGKKNLLGRHLISSTSFESYFKISIELRTKINITRTLVALTIFNEQYGHYPKELSELIENGIVNQVPLDLFSNRLLSYSFQSRKLWSTGSDEENNQGDKEKDIVLSCELIKDDQETNPCN